MSEQQKQALEPEQTSEQQSLIKLIQSLQLPKEVISSIEVIKWNDKKDCIDSLQDIQKDISEWKIWTSDASDKAKDTLIAYGIVIDSKWWENWSKPEITTGKEWLKVVNNNTEYNERFIKLSEDLNAVKSLDPTIVNTELEKAKQEKPNLPPELTKTIAEKTGVAIGNVSEVSAKWGVKQQDITNMIDAYYLSNPQVEANIKKAIQVKESGRQFGKEFDELRNSARHLDIPVYETAQNIEKLIPDKSDTTQKSVISTINSLTKESPNTLITRTGDKLTWDGAREWEKFEIDMSVHPPKLSKSQDNLSISRTEVPENPELKGARESLDRSKNTYQEASKDIHSDLKNAWYYQNLDGFSIEEVEKAFSGGQFDTYREKIQNARTPEEQEKLQQEIRTQAAQSEGILTKKGFAYMDQILSEKIEMGKIGIENAGWETATERDLNEKLRALENLKSSDKLTKYVNARREYEKEREAIKKIETPGVDTFSENASETLSILNSLGYGELGQQWLDDLLEAMNLHNKWTVEPIDLNRNPKLDNAQKKSLRTLSEDILQRFQRKAEESGKTAPTNFRELWHGISFGFQNYERFRNDNWNTREKREQFLFQNPEAEKTPERPEESTK